MKMRKNTKKTDCKYYKIQKDKTQMWQNTNRQKTKRQIKNVTKHKMTEYKYDKMQKDKL